MARQGRDFELLIEKLEKILLPEKATITSPDFLVDRITQQKREVDISIKMEIGSVPILIIIECRDRQTDQDTTWIEQLHAKTCDLNANKVIAISSSGFSQNAITKANHYGIEARTFGEISVEEIKDWWKIEFMEAQNPQCIIHHVLLETSETNIPAENLLDGKTIGDLLLTRVKEKTEVKLLSIFEIISRANNIWASIPADNNFYRKLFKIGFPSTENEFGIVYNGNLITLTSITFVVDLKIEVRKVPVSRVTTYKGEEGSITQTIEFKGILPDNNMILQIIKAKNGSLLLSARMKEEK